MFGRQIGYEEFHLKVVYLFLCLGFRKLENTFYLKTLRMSSSITIMRRKEIFEEWLVLSPGDNEESKFACALIKLVSNRMKTFMSSENNCQFVWKQLPIANELIINFDN